MSKKNINTNPKDFYFKYNRIRTKLLLFIDNEIQSKIKQNNQYIKFNYRDEIRISFEETFTQKQINKNDFPFLNNLKTEKNDNSNKSFSTTDGYSNKVNKKSNQKEINNIHSKAFVNHPNKLFNNIIFLNKKFRSIKNISRQTSSILLKSKQKNSAKYLKNLCNNLKKCKNDKKPAKYIRSISVSTKFLDSNKNKKVSKKSNEIKIRKSKKDNNLYTFSLFKKPHKGDFVSNSKLRTSGKSTYSIFIKN